MKFFYPRAKATVMLAVTLSFFACKKNPTQPEPVTLNRILFISNKENSQQKGLFTMKPDGSDVVKMATNEGYLYFQASWSPDLNLIVAAGWPPLPPGRRMEWTELYILDSDGGLQYRLAWSGEDAVWSPDGGQIAFERYGPLHIYAGIYVIDVDGSNERELKVEPHTIVHILDWSRDGKRLLVMVEKYVEGDSRPQSWELYEMDANGNLVKQITDTKDIWEYDAYWSPDESKIAFSTMGLYRDIYVMNADGTNPQIITPLGQKIITHFLWSMDGSQIAFSWQKRQARIGPDLNWTNIYVINADGAAVKQITFDDSTNAVNIATDWR